MKISIQRKEIFYSKDEALDCQAQHEGAEMDFRVGHGTMLNGKWTYEIPENRPSWTVSWTVPVSVAVEVSGGLVQAVYARGGDVGADVFDLDAPDFPGEGEQEEVESRKKQLAELIGSRLEASLVGGMNMEKITYGELKALFLQHEGTRPEKHLTGCIVFTEDSFEKPYPLESRSYVVSSNNKAYRSCMGGYSIFAHNLDGSDPHIRLEAYMAEERGGKDSWRVEYCYLM